jgi:hypothetical protein
MEISLNQDMLVRDFMFPRGRDLVVAFFGTMNEDGVEDQMPAICRQLVNAGFFDK